MNDPKPLRGGLDQYELIGSQPFAIGRTSACSRALNSQQTIVCIKQFSQQPIASGDSDSHEEFAAEITARQTLGHPNILPILDFGYREGPEKEPFLVLPLCDHDLRTVLAKKHFVSHANALPILWQVARAIDQYAHGLGVIHGDVEATQSSAVEF